MTAYTVFGDSLIREIPLLPNFWGVHCFPGTTIERLQRRLLASPRLLKHQSSSIFLMVGTNDISNKRSIDAVVTDLLRLQEIVKIVSDRPVYVCGILPRLDQPHLNHIVKVVNKRLKKNLGLGYVHPKPFLFAGKPKPGLYAPDGLHLNPEGKAVLARWLENNTSRPQ